MCKDDYIAKCDSCNNAGSIAFSNRLYNYCEECATYCDNCQQWHFVSCICDTEQEAIDKFCEFSLDREYISSYEIKEIFKHHIEKNDGGASSEVYLMKKFVIIYSDDPVKERLAAIGKYGIECIAFDGDANFWYIAPRMELANKEFVYKVQGYNKLFEHGNQFTTDYYIEQLQNAIPDIVDEDILYFAKELLEICNSIEQDFIKIDIRESNVLFYEGKPIPYDCLYLGSDEDGWIGNCRRCNRSLLPETTTHIDGYMYCPNCAEDVLFRTQNKITSRLLDIS